MKRRDYKKQQKSSKKRLIMKVFILLTLSLFSVAAAYGASLHKKAANVVEKAYEPVVERTKPEVREAKVEPTEDNVSVLFIGIDDSETRHQGEGNSRSDALLFATLNRSDKSVKLVSIPRDSYVNIPKKGFRDKITHAHAYGGTSATVETIEELFDVPVDYYVKMNFNAFIDVVDALGGIEAEVPYDRIEKDENDKYTIHLKKGKQHLDGKHALALARTRKLDTDVARGQRQQMILQSIMKEALSVKSITKYGDVIEAVGDNMKTNMTFNDMTSFFEYAKGGMPTVDTISLDGYDDMSTGTYFWKLDETNLAEVKQLLKAHLGLIPDSSNLTDSRTDLNDSSDEVTGDTYNN